MAQKDDVANQHRDIERIAQEIYQNRLLLNKSGDAYSDWQEAEEIVRDPSKIKLFESSRSVSKLRRATSRTIKFVCQDILKWFFVSLPKAEWMKLIAVPLILAGATSIITSRIQREANQTATLDNYFDQLETLTFEQGLLDQEPAIGATLLARGRTVATLRKLDLERTNQLIAFLESSGLVKLSDQEVEPVLSFRAANLSELDLRDIELSNADFRNADLRKANLRWTFLPEANLKGAILWEAILKQAVLSNANLEEADLLEANLEKAFLPGANLEGASLYKASLERANLSEANLKGADLSEANLKGADLSKANLEGTYGLTQTQLAQARICLTKFPQGISLNPNRDCEELSINPETGEVR